MSQKKEASRDYMHLTPHSSGVGKFNMIKENSFNKPLLPTDQHISEGCMLVAVTAKPCNLLVSTPKCVDLAALRKQEPSKHL